MVKYEKNSRFLTEYFTGFEPMNKLNKLAYSHHMSLHSSVGRALQRYAEATVLISLRP